MIAVFNPLNSGPPTTRREDQIHNWYRFQRNVRYAQVVYRFALQRYWYITVPVLSWILLPWWVALVVLVVCLYGHRRLEQRRTAEMWRAVKAVGGPENHTIYHRVVVSWRSTMLRHGLAVKRDPLQGKGMKRTYREALQGVHGQLAHTSQGVDPRDYEFPRLLNVSQHVLGLVLTVQLIPGQTVDNFLRQAPALQNVWKVQGVRVDQEEAGQVRLILVTSDPLREGREITSQTLCRADTQAVVVGTMESGNPMLFRMDQTNNVVGGIPGAGKSVMLNAVLAGAAFVPEIQIVGIDCKAGIEFHDWKPRLSAFGMDQTTGLEVLEKVEQVGQARLSALRGSGFKSQSRKGYTRAEPLILVVIDECAELFVPEGRDKGSKDQANDLMTIVSRGVRLYRAAGISYVLATQKPTVDVLPSIIRDNCGGRIAFLCKTNEQATAILGPEAGSAEVSPVSIPDDKDHRGYAVLGDDGGRFALGRSYWITEQTSSEIAQRSAHLRRDLDDLLPLQEPETIEQIMEGE